ncbi:glycosyltransferase family 4 protein [Akkermansiaceae bacterium]|nr:glycosyltransferase family 4 protein [Akkermansiaceae bacterium]
MESIPPARAHEGLTDALDALKPDAVCISGWGSPDARACLNWCRKNGAKAIVMSETREADGHRVWWKEWIKSRIVRRFDGALVGGRSHRDYLVKLGMPTERISVGYNVVDNAYFAAQAAKWQKLTAGMGDAGVGSSSTIQDQKSKIKDPPFFLASNRFIERKNLGRLIEAYGRYAKKSERLKAGSAVIERWNLCLLGDGELKEELVGRCRELGLEVKECAPWEDPDLTNIQHPTSKIVYFPGFRQIEELPRFYAQAVCFVHPALEEPWGLVINEAMASGLPILSSNNVGAAEELIDDGINGFTFDAENVEDISKSLVKVAEMGIKDLSSMAEASGRILEERCPTDAFGTGLKSLLKDLS